MSTWNVGITANDDWREVITDLERNRHRLPELLQQRFAKCSSEYDHDNRYDMEVLAIRSRALSNVVMIAAHPDVTPSGSYSVSPGEVRKIRSLIPADTARRFVTDAVEQLSAIDDAYARGADGGDERSELFSIAMESDAELVKSCEDAVGRAFRRAENTRFVAHLGASGNRSDSTQLHALDARMKERSEAEKVYAKAVKSGRSTGGGRSTASGAPLLVLLAIVVIAVLLVGTS